MVWFRKTGALVVVSSNWIFLYLRNYIALQSCLQCCLWLINLTKNIPICKWMTKTPKATSISQYHWLLKIKWQILFMGLSNSSFSQKVISNQWLPYISIKMVFMHSWDENTLWHDGFTKFTHPRSIGMLSMSSKIAWLLSYIIIASSPHFTMMRSKKFP